MPCAEKGGKREVELIREVGNAPPAREGGKFRGHKGKKEGAKNFREIRRLRP